MAGTEHLDEVRIREFLATDYPRVVAAVRLIAGDHPAAEDAVAETLARAWERTDRGEAIDSLPAWVTRVASNLAMSRWRRVRAELRARERMARSEEVPGGPSEMKLDLERALGALSRREREAIVLHYYLGFDVAGSAAALGVAEGTVKTLLFRARRALAAELGEDDVEEMNDHARL